MKFEIGNNIISSYKRLSYEPWYALAEFVDNSTQAYFDHKEEMDTTFEREGKKLVVDIQYSSVNNSIIIVDNSYGMSFTVLERALKVGTPPPNPNGRSKYGLGMKTAACWFGNRWSIKTKQLGEKVGHTVSIDVDVIANSEGNVEITPIEFDEHALEHYTVLTITDLNRKLMGRTLGKIKDHLRSIYRHDFADYGLILKWNGSQLEWEGFDEQLYINKQGVRYKKYFEFEINSKTVSGWVGVLGKGQGSRKKAGFSIIQNSRVIQGWPNSYKPTSIFGDQEDGSNDLVNQRLVGELIMNGFSVSHTKDKIDWEDDEEELLDKKLADVCADARDLALKLRFTKDHVGTQLPKFQAQALAVFEKELVSSEIVNYLNTAEPFPETIIHKSYSKFSSKVREESQAALIALVGRKSNSVTVYIYFSEKSEFDPYYVLDMTVEENSVIVIINELHPFISEMNSADALLNFIRQIVYDGIAEWKSTKILGNIQPNTVKFLKDGLMRIPYQITQNQ